MALGCIRVGLPKSGSGCPDPYWPTSKREAVSGCSRQIRKWKSGTADPRQSAAPSPYYLLISNRHFFRRLFED